MSTLIPRIASQRLAALAGAFRVVIVNGPRQSGKSTLLRQYHDVAGGSYRSLDEKVMLEAAKEDPQSFATYGDTPRMIDEVQRGGDWLVRAIKLATDESPFQGQFILSGSSRFLTIPSLSESLAGRAVFVDMWPLSLAERTEGPTNFLEVAFSDLPSLLQDSRWGKLDYLEVIVSGGYPEVLTVDTPLLRSAWYEGYLSTVINRDIGDIAQVHHAKVIPQILRLLTARAGSTLVASDVSQATDLGREATRAYLSYLDMVFLTIEIPAWSTNLTSKIAKSPKVYPSDSGLAAHNLQVDIDTLATPGNSALGGLLETFVATELVKLLTFSDRRYDLRHLRDRSGHEVDFIVEGAGGRVLALEVKASVSPGSGSAKHIRWLREKLGERFVGGVILHLGQRSVSFGDNIYALPLSSLWGHSELPPRQREKA